MAPDGAVRELAATLRIHTPAFPLATHPHARSMYSTVSILKLFNVVPRLLNEDNFLMKYLVLYLADAYFCQVSVSACMC